MRVIVTDTGWIWNHKNPILEKFDVNVVFVVCLNGKKVTDKYKYFISPYKEKEDSEWETEEYGLESRKYQALESVGDDLYFAIEFLGGGEPEDFLFLTDGNPESLYPFFAMKSRQDLHTFHLCAMSPWRFESEKIKSAYRDMVSDMTQLRSVMYIDSDRILDRVISYDALDSSPSTGSSDLAFSSGFKKKLLEEATDECVSLLPRVISSIEKIEEQLYFDFASMSYIPMKEGMEKIDLSKASEEPPSMQVLESVHSGRLTLGMVNYDRYPLNNKRTKTEVEKPIARIDGKQICKYLRDLRIKLAQANGIEFSSEVCPSIGPCAGTCAKCDAEARYLRKELKKIPVEEQVIPNCTLKKW